MVVKVKLYSPIVLNNNILYFVGRNGTVRRVERIIYLWAATVISALAWLLKLVTDVFTLSISVGTTL